MTRTKIILSIVLATVFLAAQVIAVGAAPANQDSTPITGTVESISLDTDADTGITTVLVTLNDGTETTQTVRLSLEDATTFGLVVDNMPVDPTTLTDPLEIDPALVIQDALAETGEEAQHPVGSALSDFFSNLLNVDYDTIMDYHDNGAGFGVIAQALWMSNVLSNNEDSEMSAEDWFEAIMLAKQDNAYDEITLPDGSTPKNWGQFRKAVMQDQKKAEKNLGAIMSGRADNGQGEEVQTETLQTNGNGNKPDKNNGKGQDKSNNGKNNNNGNKNKSKNH